MARASAPVRTLRCGPGPFVRQRPARPSARSWGPAHCPGGRSASGAAATRSRRARARRAGRRNRCTGSAAERRPLTRPCSCAAPPRRRWTTGRAAQARPTPTALPSPRVRRRPGRPSRRAALVARSRGRCNGAAGMLQPDCVDATHLRQPSVVCSSSRRSSSRAGFQPGKLCRPTPRQHGASPHDSFRTCYNTNDTTTRHINVHGGIAACPCCLTRSSPQGNDAVPYARHAIPTAASRVGTSSSRMRPPSLLRVAATTPSQYKACGANAAPPGPPATAAPPAPPSAQAACASRQQAHQQLVGGEGQRQRDGPRGGVLAAGGRGGQRATPGLGRAQLQPHALHAVRQVAARARQPGAGAAAGGAGGRGQRERQRAEGRARPCVPVGEELPTAGRPPGACPRSTRLKPVYRKSRSVPRLKDARSGEICRGAGGGGERVGGTDEGGQGWAERLAGRGWDARTRQLDTRGGGWRQMPCRLGTLGAWLPSSSVTRLRTALPLTALCSAPPRRPRLLSPYPPRRRLLSPPL
jgi:hypothetical protein